MSSSKSSQSTATETNAFDYRKAVGDAGILAETGAAVDASATNIDARDLSDHSAFNLDASDQSVSVDSRNLSDNSTNIDSRNLSDNSSFAITSTDARSTVDSRNLSDNSTNIDSRDLSDNSTFSITSTDARSTVDSRTTHTTNTDARDLSDRSSFALDASDRSSRVDSSVTTVNAADADVLRATASGAFSSANLITAGSLQLYESALAHGDAASVRAVQAQIGAVDQLGETTKSAVQLASQAAGIVAASNSTAGTAGNVEKAIKAAALVAVAFAVALIFRKSK